MAAFLLCTDLDGTVLGDPGAEAAFHAWKGRMGERVALAYVTGRAIEDVRSLIADGRIPEADYAATDVGTLMWDLRDPQNRLGRHYRDLADPAWPAQLFRQLGRSETTPLQDPGSQGRFKASFFWDGEAGSLRAFKDRMRGQRDWRLLVTAGQYLDLLPHCYSKGQALRFLAAASGLGLKRCIAAGDMEHDLDMFEAAGSGIVPSNALPALKDALAQGSAYLSGRPEAWGLLDGLHRMGLE
jgi:hydroxymethylpyrimidine pyrophosphatase-like HAD family hydrolase